MLLQDSTGYCSQGKMAQTNAPLDSKFHKILLHPRPSYIINKSGSDFQQGGCLYKATSSILWIMDLQMSDMPQNNPQDKLSSQLLTILQLW